MVAEANSGAREESDPSSSTTRDRRVGGYAGYVGRIGALAAALGVGVAVATGQGIGAAHADPDTNEVDSTTESTSQPTSADPTTGERIDSSLSPPMTSGPSITVPSVEAPAQGSAADDKVPDMKASNTGGAHTSGDDDEATDDETLTTGEIVEDDVAEDDPVSAEPVEPSTPPPLHERVTSAEAHSNESASKQLPDTADAFESVSMTLPSSTSDQRTLAQKTAVPDDEESPASGERFFTAAAATEDVASTPLVSPSRAANPVEALIRIPVAVVSATISVISGVLSAVLSPGPTAPAEPPLLWALLGWVRREVQRTLFNTTPDALDEKVVAAVDTSAVIDVLANDSDDEGDQIRVASFTQPLNGTVTQNADGTLTYTPEAGFTGVDTFTYSIADSGYNVVSDPLRALTGRGPRTDTATVEMNVGVTTLPSRVIAHIDVHDEAYAVALSPDGTRLYVAARRDVAVIDPAARKVVARIPTPARGIALSADGTRAYVNNDRGVSVIDTATNAVIADIPIAGTRGGLAVSPDGTRAYVTTADGVTVIDTAANAVNTTIAVSGAFKVAVSPDGTRAYVTTGGGVAVIDTATNAVSTTITVGSTDITVSPDGTRLYVSYALSEPTRGNNVWVIDTSTHKTVFRYNSGINRGWNPVGVAVSADGKHVYISNNSGRPNVLVIDSVTNDWNVIDMGPLHRAERAVVSPDGTRAYVPIRNKKTVAVIA